MLVAAEDAEEVDLELPEGRGLLRILGDFPAHLLEKFYETGFLNRNKEIFNLPPP